MAGGAGGAGTAAGAAGGTQGFGGFQPLGGQRTQQQPQQVYGQSQQQSTFPVYNTGSWGA